MSFINIGDMIINLDHVRKIWWRRKKDDKPIVSIAFVDEGEHERFEDDEEAYAIVESLEATSAPVVAAYPGFKLLRLWFGDEEPSVDAIVNDGEPIIAWRIQHNQVHPIIIDDPCTPEYDKGVWAIMQPNGVVIRPFSESWSNIDAWGAHVVDQWKKWHTKSKVA